MEKCRELDDVGVVVVGVDDLLGSAEGQWASILPFVSSYQLHINGVNGVRRFDFGTRYANAAARYSVLCH